MAERHDGRRGKLSDYTLNHSMKQSVEAGWGLNSQSDILPPARLHLSKSSGD